MGLLIMSDNKWNKKDKFDNYHTGQSLTKSKIKIKLFKK